MGIFPDEHGTAHLPLRLDPSDPILHRCFTSSFTYQSHEYWAGGGESVRALRHADLGRVSGDLIQRIIDMTEYDNVAPQREMEHLGRTLKRNPLEEPEWLQVVATVETREIAGVV